MTGDDLDDDPVLSLVSSLKIRDVDSRRAERLRARCHASLRSRAKKAASHGFTDRAWLRHTVATSAAGAWCLVYLLEIIKRAAIIYGH